MLLNKSHLPKDGITQTMRHFICDIVIGWRNQTWLLQNRQHRRYARQYPLLKALPARERGVRVAIGRNVQRTQQHHLTERGRRLRGSGHRR